MAFASSRPLPGRSYRSSIDTRSIHTPHQRSAALPALMGQVLVSRKVSPAAERRRARPPNSV